MAKIDFGQFRFGGMPGGQGGKTWTARSEMPGKKVFSGMSKGLRIHRASKHGQNPAAEYQIKDHQHQSGSNHQDDGIPYTLSGPLFLLHSQT